MSGSDALRCAYCREPIAGPYFTNGWDERYCAHHPDEWPQCTFCHRLMPNYREQAQSNDASHPRCTQCAAVAVEDAAIAQPMVGHLIEWLRDEGVTLDRPVRFRARLVERQDLLGETEDDPDALGRAYTTTRGNAPIKLELHLLRGMPSPMFEGVAVHELGHAWMSCRHVTGLPKWAEEGFCEWVSHRWYLHKATRDARYYAEQVENNENPVYGGGFRRLRDLEGRYGFDAIVDHLIARKKLPR